MNPISAAIEAIERLIGHSPHPAIVAVPIGAYFVSNVCDLAAAATGSKSFDDTARISLGIGLVGAVGAAVTGLHDYAKIPADRPSHAVATSHGLGNAAATALMAGSFLARALDHARGEGPGAGARLLGLAGGGLTVYTAWLGGKLVAELGEGVNPMMEQRRQGSSLTSAHL